MMSDREDSPTTVHFYFDPLCPFAWLTSLWIREVRKDRPVQVEWKFFSLAGADDPDDTWHGPLRIAALARREGGNAAVDAAYLALGRFFHERPESFQEIDRLAELIAPYLADVGLDPALASRALGDPSTTDEVLRDHREAMDRYAAFGVPWLVVDGDEAGFFGPVIGELLKGNDAVTLWDDFVRMSARPYLYELKRGRKGLQDLDGLSAGFEPEREKVGSAG
jgi:2-hydroxychromene-2-carboxylate isomerase